MPKLPSGDQVPCPCLWPSSHKPSYPLVTSRWYHDSGRGGLISHHSLLFVKVGEFQTFGVDNHNVLLREMNAADRMKVEQDQFTETLGLNVSYT